MANTNPTTATPVPADPLPKYTASGAPVTRAYRIAFQVWVVCFLLTIVATLIFYLFDKTYYAIYGR